MAVGSASAGEPLDHRVGEGFGSEAAAEIPGLAVVVKRPVVGGLDSFRDLTTALVLAGIRQVIRRTAAVISGPIPSPGMSTAECFFISVESIAGLFVCQA